MFTFNYNTVYKLLFSIMALLFLQSSWANEKVPKPEDILAQDGDTKITREEASLMLEDMNDVQRQRFVSNKSKLEQLLLEFLIHKKKTNEALKLGLDKNKFAQWKIELAKSNVLVAELAKHVRDNVKVPDNIEANAKEYYRAHPEDFRTQENKVHAAHILFSVENGNTEQKKKQQELAIKVLDELRKGADFSTLAKKYSADSSNASHGGELPLFPRGQMVPPFEKAAFSLKKANDLSDVVETSFGFHIIKLLEDNDFELNVKPYELVRSELVNVERDKYIGYEVSKYFKAFDTDEKSTMYVPAIDSFYKSLKERVEKDKQKLN